MSGTASYQFVEMSKPSLQHDRVEGELTQAAARELYSDAAAAPRAPGKAKRADNTNDEPNILSMWQ